MTMRGLPSIALNPVQNWKIIPFGTFKTPSKAGIIIGHWALGMGQWQVWVNFGSECRSVVCDWLEAV
ncbi:hypothetical protein CDG77_33970 [Nostoc sp. 'Peltigera membranacea cyanobiont' 213]|nr:hypothetical protein CDG77_33970 [Nostoc sp. 'Peltigera membranacea cyanobiont' 213]